MLKSFRSVALSQSVSPFGFTLKGWQCGRVVRAPGWKSGGPGLKSRSRTAIWSCFSPVAPSSTHRPCTQLDCLLPVGIFNHVTICFSDFQELRCVTYNTNICSSAVGHSGPTLAMMKLFLSMGSCPWKNYFSLTIIFVVVLQPRITNISKSKLSHLSRENTCGVMEN